MPLWMLLAGTSFVLLSIVRVTSVGQVAHVPLQIADSTMLIRIEDRAQGEQIHAMR